MWGLTTLLPKWVMVARPNLVTWLRSCSQTLLWWRYWILWRASRWGDSWNLCTCLGPWQSVVGHAFSSVLWINYDVGGCKVMLTEFLKLFHWRNTLLSFPSHAWRKISAPKTNQRRSNESEKGTQPSEYMIARKMHEEFAFHFVSRFADRFFEREQVSEKESSLFWKFALKMLSLYWCRWEKKKN